MARKGLRPKYLLVLVAVAFVVSMVIASNAKPELDLFGIEGYYSTVEEFLPFSVVSSENLSCRISQLIYNVDDLGNRRLQSGGGIEENVVPKQRLDLVTTTTGNKIKQVEGELRVKCTSSSTIDPYISNGNVVFQIFATNQKGETVKIKDTGFVQIKSGNIDGTTATIAKWSMTANDIENLIGSGTTTYVTVVNSNAVGTLYFKEKPSDTKEFFYHIRGDTNAAFKYKVVSKSTTNIIDDITGLKQRKVEVSLLNSDDAIIDVRKTNRITVVGSLYDWEQQKEGYPIVSLYYNDPKATPSGKITPIQQKTLTSFKGSSGTGKVADFAYSLYLGSNPKLGEYKVTFSSSLKDGKPIRDTVASITFQVIKSKPTCEETGTCPPPPTCSDTETLVNGKCVPIDDEIIDEYAECLRTGNLDCLMNAINIPVQFMTGIIIFIVLLIVIAIGIAIAKRPKPYLPRY